MTHPLLLNKRPINQGYFTHHGPEEREDWLEGPCGAGAAAVAAVGEEHAAHVPRRVGLPTDHEHGEQQNL